MNLVKSLVKLGIVFILGTLIVLSKSAAKTADNAIYLSYHQRLMISYLLAGAGATEDKKELIASSLREELVRNLSAPRQDYRVKSFAEFVKLYRGDWPNSHSVKSDLKIIRSRPAQGIRYIQGNSEQLQNQINAFLANQREEIKKLVTSNEFLAPIAGEVWENIQSLAKHRILNIQTDSRSSDFIKRWIFRSFSMSEKLLYANFEKVQKIGALDRDQGSSSGSIDDSTATDQMPAGMTSFVLEVLKEYFNRLGIDSKKQILSQLLGIDLKANQQDKFEVMVLNSGPQFQKLLQILARESNIPPHLVELFKKLESNISQVPAELSGPIIAAGKQAHQILSFEKDPLGVGTLAQTHKAIVQTFLGPQEVVVRFLKPGIEKRVDEDSRILREIAPLIDQNKQLAAQGLPKVAPLVEDLNQTVMDELIIAATIGRQLTGRAVYSKEVFFNGKTYKTFLQINVPNVLAPKGSSSLHVQDLAPGEKLDELASQYEKVIPDLKKVLIEEIAKVWIQEALFGSGFFHSDLHQGNFLVEITDATIRVSILDFGMGGSLPPAARSNILSLGAGVELQRADIIAKALWGLSDISRNEIVFDKFLRLVEIRSRLIQKGQLSFQRMDKWTTWASNLGIRFPTSFVGFNRGFVILDKSLAEANSPLTVAKIGKNLVAQNTKEVLTHLRHDARLEIADLVKLGWIAQSKKLQSERQKPAKNPISCHKIGSL